MIEIQTMLTLRMMVVTAQIMLVKFFVRAVQHLILIQIRGFMEIHIGTIDLHPIVAQAGHQRLI